MAQTADIDWDAGGAPRSRRFDDIYFSRDGGLAESKAVFLQGCGLPDAWRGRRRFVVGELGFGTGLNILALLDLWRHAREPGARLHIFSVEAYPPSLDAGRRALALWPELADLARTLTSAWPTARGFHRVDFPAQDAVLDVAVMEAAEALSAWDGKADAWFLDGFSPAKNPEMWRGEVLKLVARRSAPGARAATFTVAGAVRRGLQAQGFSVAKRPGFGAKGERLEATLTGPAPSLPARWTAGSPRVCIVGAGIAGAALAWAFRDAGLETTILDGGGIGAGASGNPAALVTPRFDAGGGAPAQLHAQAFERARGLYGREAPHAIIACGALQLEVADRDASRFERIAGSDLFEPGIVVRMDAAQAGQRLGERVSAGGLWLPDALVIEPAAALSALIGEDCVILDKVARFENDDRGWSLISDRSDVLCRADILCVAGGFGSRALIPQLELQAVRGQASLAKAAEPPAAAAWGGYLIPTREGLLFGATHDRGQIGEETRPQDHLRNLAALGQMRPALAASLAVAELGACVGVRAATRDSAPLAGAVAERSSLYVLCGLGGRGFTLAPLLAEHVAALALGAPSPLPSAIGRSVRPDRFGHNSAGA